MHRHSCSYLGGRVDEIITHALALVGTLRGEAKMNR